MKLNLFLALMLLCGCSTPERKRSVKGPLIVSYKKEYASFLQSKDEAVLKKILEEREELYEIFVFRGADFFQRQKVLTDYQNSLVTLKSPAALDGFNKVEAFIPAILKRYVQRFPRETFDFPIYILPTLNRFSGRVDFLGEKAVAVFGPDNMARFSEDVEILVAHELFHAVHFRALKLSKAWMEKYEDLLIQLWFEGLASYMSLKLNDRILTLDEAFGHRVADKCAPHIRKLRNKFILQMEETRVPDKELENAWFGEGDKNQDLPAMAGYCLGFALAEKLSQKMTDQELLKLDPVKQRSRLFKGLNSL